MSHALAMTLMFFAAIGFAGAGVARAVARAHEMVEAETDLGMRAVMLLLFAFGAACMYVAAGVAGILGFGAVVAWFSYILTAHRLRVFRIEQVQQQAELPAERRRIA